MDKVRVNLLESLVLPEQHCNESCQHLRDLHSGLRSRNIVGWQQSWSVKREGAGIAKLKYICIKKQKLFKDE